MRILNRQDARKIKRKSDRGHPSPAPGNEETQYEGTAKSHK